MRSVWILLCAVGVPAVVQGEILPRPPRTPVPAGALWRLIADTRVGEAAVYNNMVVYPLFSSGCGLVGYWTLEQAVAKGLLRISEKGEGSVPELLVENLSDEPVFLLAGEILRGGKQNRVISQDVLLPPRSGPIRLGVFCVEERRWAKQTRYFQAESELAHAGLRGRLGSPALSQSGVWGEVRRKFDAVAASPGQTFYLGNMYENRAVRESVEEFCRAVRLPGDANGMAVLIGGRVVGVEIFGDAGSFAGLREKLLRSYAVDAIERPLLEPPYDTGGWKVERFLRSAQTAQLFPQPTIGLGRLLRLQHRSHHGTVLIWDAQKAAHGVVHAGLFG
jgi:hypothetical protein